MRARIRERVRLQRRRLNHRYRHARFFALLCAALFVVFEIAGWRGAYAIWGDPQNPSRFWWHFPVFAAFVFLAFMFWPFHEDVDDQPR